jgi:EAL domain-containing protein (putative c-di-GMP-specific phosphodiesterase class I)/FixJ family two-component response regulator
MNITDMMRQLKGWLISPWPAVDEDDTDEIAEVIPRQPASRACFVVDDEPAIRQLLREILLSYDIAVEEYSGVSRTFLERVASKQPALIFMDIMLEDSDAVEALLGLSKLKYKGKVQLISGRGTELLRDVQRIGKNHRINMLPVMEKPLRPNMLSDVVEHVYSSAPPPILETTASISLAEALTENWVTVWYQPKIDLKRMCLVGTESLARVEHPTRGLFLPSSFLPQAEPDDLVRLTEHILVTTLHDWPDIYKAAGGPLTPAINVPVAALNNARIARLFRRHAPKHPEWHGMIAELMESQIVNDIELACEIATQLKIYNIELSIDDFGEGYSSFSRLKEVPFCELKIDRQFVKNCAKNEINSAICQSVIDLAHRLNCVAVAEGVDNEADLRALHQMGCDMVQGFLLARPMPKERLTAVLRQRREKSRAATVAGTPAAPAPAV